MAKLGGPCLVPVCMSIHVNLGMLISCRLKWEPWVSNECKFLNIYVRLYSRVEPYRTMVWMRSMVDGSPTEHFGHCEPAQLHGHITL